VSNVNSHEIYKEMAVNSSKVWLAILSNSDTIMENVLITLSIIPMTLTALLMVGHINLHTVKPNYITTSVYTTPHLIYSVKYSVVPIHSSLLTVTLYSLVITTLILNDKIFSPFHGVITGFDCII
jgi:hypothetical protein